MAINILQLVDSYITLEHEAFVLHERLSYAVHVQQVQRSRFSFIKDDVYFDRLCKARTRAMDRYLRRCDLLDAIEERADNNVIANCLN